MTSATKTGASKKKTGAATKTRTPKKKSGGERNRNFFVCGSISEPAYVIHATGHHESMAYLSNGGGWGDREHAQVFDSLSKANRARGTSSIVICTTKSAIYCPDCIPPEVLENIGEDWVDTWRIESDGWVSAPICDVCRVAIRVYVDGMDKEKE